MLLFLSSLYDNWINLGSIAIKPFDIIFILLSIFNFSRNSFRLRIDKYDKLLIFLLIIYFLISIINNPEEIIRNLYLLIIFPYGFLVGKSLKKNYVYRIITFTLGLWILSFVFQYLSFYLMGAAPDLLIFSSQFSRIDNVETFIGPRFSGLSVEPYQYTFTVSLLSIALITHKYNFNKMTFLNLNVRDVALLTLSLVTTLLSGSFFVYINIFFCFLIFLPYIFKTILKQKIKIIPFSIIFIISISLSLFLAAKSNLILQRIASEALDFQAIEIVSENPTDSLNRSFYDRTARLFSAQCRDYVFDQTILIGDGLDTINYHPKCGMNLVSFIVVNFGFLGSLVLYFSLFKRLDNLAKWWLLFTSFFVYPIVGSIFLPFVLGCLMKKEKNSNERQNKTLST